MKLTPPKQITFWIAVIAGVLGLLGYLAVPALAPYAFFLVAFGFILLVVALLVKGL